MSEPTVINTLAESFLGFLGLGFAFCVLFFGLRGGDDLFDGVEHRDEIKRKKKLLKSAGLDLVYPKKCGADTYRRGFTRDANPYDIMKDRERDAFWKWEEGWYEARDHD